MEIVAQHHEPRMLFHLQPKHQIRTIGKTISIKGGLVGANLLTAIRKGLQRGPLRAIEMVVAIRTTLTKVVDNIIQVTVIIGHDQEKGNAATDIIREEGAPAAKKRGTGAEREKRRSVERGIIVIIEGLLPLLVRPIAANVKVGLGLPLLQIRPLPIQVTIVGEVADAIKAAVIGLRKEAMALL